MAAALLFGYNKWVDHEAIIESAKNNIAQQTLQAQVKANDDLKVFVQQQQAQYTQLVATLSAQNANLISAIGQRTVAVQKQQQIDQNATPDYAVGRFQTLLHVQPTDIQISSDRFSFSHLAAFAVLNQLELVPALEQDLDDGKVIVANKDKQIDSLTGLNSDLTKQVQSCTVTVADEKKACDTQISDLKATQRKKSRNWFIKGLAVGGAVVGYLILHY